jgi:hypothetical protein
MAMDHAALLEVLEARKSAGVDERIKVAATTIYQALIDAELTSVIGAGPWESSTRWLRLWDQSDDCRNAHPIHAVNSALWLDRS